MGLQKNETRFARFIEKLITPTHIEFWRLPDVGISYMQKGYSLSPPSIEELTKVGLRQTSEKAIMDFLEKNHVRLKGKVLLLLTKLAAN